MGKEKENTVTDNKAKQPYGVIHADCLEAMRKMPDGCIDAIVTDPPYGLSFMGKNWDHGVPGVEFWKEALRIAKPGAHLLSFGGTRTFHRIACAIEDAGWEIRDCVMWLHSQGFPKSMDISKAIDKKIGEEEEKAKKWNGWGTCLKPAYEPVIMARKPLDGRTVVDPVLKYGTGGINIDECRVPSDKPVVIHSPAKDTLYESGHKDMGTWTDNRGRFPANVIHDGSEEVENLFPGDPESSSSPSRFFYCAKASKSEKGKDNPHPTVKPLELMKYLIKMVAPKDAVVLDPFMGSGSTGVAAIQIDRRFIGIEKEEEYFNYAKKRIEDAFSNSRK